MLPRLVPVSVLLLLAVTLAAGAAAAELSPDDAWKALPKYEYGHDMAPLLVLDQQAIASMRTPAARAAFAARLAGVLSSAEATPAARQYACLQLRQVGTAAEVPLLARLLARPEMAEHARQTLEAIPGDVSLAALRNALPGAAGAERVALIQSLARRRDAKIVPQLIELTNSKDVATATAAIDALGSIANTEAIASLRKLAETKPSASTVPLLRAADSLAALGKNPEADSMYASLAEKGVSPAARRAAAEGQLRLAKEGAAALIAAWFVGSDADRRAVAAGHLAKLDSARFDQLVGRLSELSDASKLILIETLAARNDPRVAELARGALTSSDPALQRFGIRCLGRSGDASSITFLLESLAKGGETASAAQDALCRLPRPAVTSALLKTLKAHPELRPAVVEVLKQLRCYEAIDPLVALARSDDPAVYDVALDGLRGIADPDNTDLSRLVKLLFDVPAGRQRDEVEKTIAIVCDKLPQGKDHAEPVLAVLAKVGRVDPAVTLPLFGRLGGPKALAAVEAAMRQSDAVTHQAAVRALCNWRTAEVADRLWQLANEADSAEHRQWALRGYVRVVTLKSDRPEIETLAMLKKAMAAAKAPEDRQLILNRASNIRTIETVEWLAGYLDDPQVNQAACRALVELAHHRFLRQPNMNRFGPLLEKVKRTAKDPALVERAEKYRLGM